MSSNKRDVYCGENLIACSFPEYVSLIAAAPDLLVALEQIVETVRVSRIAAETLGRLNKDGETTLQCLELLADIAKKAVAKVKEEEHNAP